MAHYLIPFKTTYQRLFGEKMPTLVLLLGAFGCLLLFIATIYLVKLNWSTKIITPPSVIFLGAVVTTFITILLFLKETKIEAAFSASVIIDKTQNLPAMLPFNRENEKVSLRLSNVASLGRPFIEIDGKSQLTIKTPSNFDEINQFCQELLTYKIFRDIERIQRLGWTISTSATTVTGKINTPVKLSESEAYSGAKLQELAAQNRFSSGLSQQFELEMGKLVIPLGTTVRFASVPSSPKTGPSKHKLILEKPNFFTIEIVVEGIGSVNIPPTFPAGVKIPNEQIHNYQTYLFVVRMNAVFEKWTAENWRTEEYKNWTTWIFTQLQEELSD
jgi:hypothetical protein